MNEEQGPRIVDLLAALAREPDLLREYGENPDALFDRFQLTDRQRKILLSHDLIKIRDAVQYEADVPDEAFWLFVWLGGAHWLYESEPEDE